MIPKNPKAPKQTVPDKLKKVTKTNPKNITKRNAIANVVVNPTSEIPQTEMAKKGRPRSSKSKHYVDNVAFTRLINEYYKTNVFSEELGEMINKISQHVTYMPSFINYTYHASMISDSNYKIVKALNERKFDPEKGSAFSYFTKVCIRAFVHIIKKEKKKEITIEKYQSELYDELILNGYANGATDHENYEEF